MTRFTPSFRASPPRSAKGWKTPSLQVSSGLSAFSEAQIKTQHFAFEAQSPWKVQRKAENICCSPDLQLYHSETLELMLQRWSKLERDFRMKNGRYDISKIPDIYDCVKYDVIHNATLGLEDTLELFRLSRALADIVIPQVRGRGGTIRMVQSDRSMHESLYDWCANKHMKQAAPPGARKRWHAAEAKGFMWQQNPLCCTLQLWTPHRMLTLFKNTQCILSAIVHLYTGPHMSNMIDDGSAVMCCIAAKTSEAKGKFCLCTADIFTVTKCKTFLGTWKSHSLITLIYSEYILKSCSILSSFVCCFFAGIWHKQSGETGHSIRLLPPTGQKDPAGPAEDSRGRVCQQAAPSVGLRLGVAWLK